ncbi:protein RUFY3 [Crotalus adamanteus]|uniref:Protein RUFY3 n=1 Tax=Crotalus adamanteus TaxID=8729 RepID=A0AAW1B9K4_CROAD
MWLIPRLQLSERECQSLQEDNRLFKLEFGDKIDSLQVEVEQLTKQRGQLEVELRRERWLHLPHGVPDYKSLFSPNKGIQKTGSKIDSSDRQLEGDSQWRASVKENTGLSSSVFPDLQDEQEQTSEKPKPCQLCQQENTWSKRKNTCKNCGGVFCEDCSVNELPLPSSINPERVCNLCHKHLIQQYSASPS